ncbi:alpha/beta fold hydrolase [Frigoribacterium sp. VKM Ac-2836]|uniref:alpha/beta fold hydrolase n=1 Tax=Frigoribacterium sp. VKM Ac-2836 TaxID=2739014 RepID=UPI001C26BA3E|nr:alpha/beta hydrolase [Frigoribacterium sp. VKM Ac-2836]
MIQNRVPVRGSEIAVDIYGNAEGPTILMIPGVMADAASWAAVAQRLEGWSAVAVLNRRGRHPSGPLTQEYSLELEVEDALTALRRLPTVQTLFGWSYGALIALHAANEHAVPHLIGYEPIMAPFGAAALPGLERAHDAGDLDVSVEVALREVAGMPDAVIESLRADDAVWPELRRLSTPIHAETRAINDAPRPAGLAEQAQRVDLIVGERNRGQAPYGTTFEGIAGLLPDAAVHVLGGQGHLAHLEAPSELATIVDILGRASS